VGRKIWAVKLVFGSSRSTQFLLLVSLKGEISKGTARRSYTPVHAFTNLLAQCFSVSWATVLQTYRDVTVTTRMQYDKALLLLTRVTFTTYVIIKILSYALILKYKFLKVNLHSYTKSLQFTTCEFSPKQSRKVNVFVNSKTQSKFRFTSQYVYWHLLKTRISQCHCLLWHQSLGDFSCLECSTVLVNRIFA
jgi:hypothetical protein